ncbi:MAG: TonB-dependent receptor [Gammaproteobacteria bacterium]|nr:TonB-dependent receptor [Gammaproteobacteria bacterium]
MRRPGRGRRAGVRLPSPSTGCPRPAVRRVHAHCLAGLLAAVCSTVTASEAAEGHSGEGFIEEIVVIGSLIKRRTVYDGRAPIQTLEAELFESTGAAQPVDILKNLTANTGSTLATEQNYLQGTSQFSLRGLGLSSTLTLVNGRRAGVAPVSNDVGHSFFDINTLPLAMIERIEILRDGASTTYGSQAVAGVANVVTRTGFEGLEVTAGYRESSNRAYDLGFASGFAIPKGHVNVYGAYYRQDENFRTDFDWLVSRAVDPDGDGDIVDGSFDSGRGSPGSLRRAVANDDGTFSPFQVHGLDAPRFPDPDCRAAGGYPSGSLCRMDFSDQRTSIAAERRTQFFAEAEFDPSERLSVFAELGYSDNAVTDRVGNMLLFNGNVERTNEFFVPAHHPFNFWTDPDDDGVLTYVPPEEWRPGLHEAVDLGYFGRPLGAEASADNAGHERRRYDNLRALLGVTARLSDTWTGTAHFTRAQSKLGVAADRHWVAAEFARVLLEGLWNPFGTRLTAPELVTPKNAADDALPTGLLGRRAANDAATLARFKSTRIESAETVQRVAEVVFSGDLPPLRGHGMALAFGAQHRALRYGLTPDPLNAVGAGPRAIREFPARAEQEVWAMFAEHLATFGNIGELQLAVRHENYDRAGRTTDPKVAAQAFVTDWLSLRGSWGTSFQAPSVFQTAGNRAVRTLSDPFRFDGQGRGQCTVDAAGVIVDRGDNFAMSAVLRGGTLRPQSARLANFGLLLQPSMDSGVSLDYWTMHYRDVIAQRRSFQAILDDDCRDDGRPNDVRVQRDSSGQLSVVTTDYENVARVRTEGMDLNAYYDIDAPFGQLRLSADATLLTKFAVDAAGGGFEDKLGTRNDTNGFGPTPELRFNLGLSWVHGRHGANVTLRHIDAYRNDEVASLPEIDAWTTVDVRYAYSFPGPFGGEATVSVGANNATDEDPPPLPSGRDGSQRYNLRPGFDGFVHDIKGRELYVRFRWRW